MFNSNEIILLLKLLDEYSMIYELKYGIFFRNICQKVMDKIHKNLDLNYQDKHLLQCICIDATEDKCNKNKIDVLNTLIHKIK